MHIAVAGSGDLARYICEEFPKAGHTVVLLTRSHKPHFPNKGVEQFITDYTLPTLALALGTATVLISTIGDTTPAYIPVHTTLLEACRSSPTCKHFIPSEFAGDVRVYPDQPGFYYRSREPLRSILRKQSEVQWTVVAVGWLADYFLPLKNRYIKDIGEACPVNITGGKITIPGTGEERVDFTWARDVIKGLAELVEKTGQWEEYTYMSGEQSCWREVADFAKAKYPDMKVTEMSLYDIAEMFRAAGNEEELIVAEHYLYSVSGASSLPVERVAEHRTRFFLKTKFRSVKEGFSEFEHDDGVIP